MSSDVARPRLRYRPGVVRLRRPQLGTKSIRRGPRKCESTPQVIDDLPAVVPVTIGEIGLIETYLGALIDGVLDPGGKDPSSTAQGEKTC